MARHRIASSFQTQNRNGPQLGGLRGPGFQPPAVNGLMSRRRSAWIGVGARPRASDAESSDGGDDVLRNPSVASSPGTIALHCSQTAHAATLGRDQHRRLPSSVHLGSKRVTDLRENRTRGDGGRVSRPSTAPGNGHRVHHSQAFGRCTDLPPVECGPDAAVTLRAARTFRGSLPGGVKAWPVDALTKGRPRR